MLFCFIFNYQEFASLFASILRQSWMLGNRITDAAITLGDALVPALMSALDALEPLFASIEEGATWFASLDVENQKFIITVAAMVAAAGPLLIVTGKLVESIGLLIPVVKGLGAAFSWLAATPWGLVLASAAMVTTAFFTIKNAIDSNRESIEALRIAQLELQTIQANGINESEVASTQQKIDKLNDLTNSYRELITVASQTSSALRGASGVNRALGEASEKLGVNFKDLKKEAAALGVELRFVDDKGKLAAVSTDQLADVTKTLSNAIKEAINKVY
ncbi:hypothetical protein ACQKLN_03610 [Paenibacillus glucanolyticus]|uniref:hypothetical protein n=1 Tax=Paenibacillus glucanolyticus TaxID=59843 RepID=UPI00368A48AA